MVLVVKNPPVSYAKGDIRDVGSIPGSGRSSGGGNGNPLQYSCLKKSSWIEETDGLQSIGSQRVRHNWGNLAHTHYSYFIDFYWVIYLKVSKSFKANKGFQKFLGFG